MTGTGVLPELRQNWGTVVAVVGVILFSFLAFSVLQNPTMRFSTVEECQLHYAKTAIFSDLGAVAISGCSVAFDPASYDDSDIPVASCVLKHFEDITDHTAGRQIVSQCAKGSSSPMAKAYFARFEDPAVRAAREARDAAEEAKNSAVNGVREVPQPAAESGPLIMQINGETKTCIRIGVLLDCS